LVMPYNSMTNGFWPFRQVDTRKGRVVRDPAPEENLVTDR
jgi:hypothetical protein